jgi:hypothetical protein
MVDVKSRPNREPGRAASFDDLPNELLLEILRHLQHLLRGHPDRLDLQLPSLVSLSLVNRRLHAIISDKLYATYHSHYCSPYPFLRTVISDQQLAKKVQSVEWHCTSDIADFETPKKKPYLSSAVDKKTIKEGLRAIQLPGWKAWASDCNEVEPALDILYAAILMHTSNVTSLRIIEGDMPHKTPKWLELIRWAVSGSRVGQLHQFVQLKKILLDVGNLKLRHLTPLFRLQSLRRLDLVGLLELNDTVEGKADHLSRLVPAASSPIEILSLTESFMDTCALVTLINFVQQLRQLDYYHEDFRWRWHASRSEEWGGPQDSPAAAITLHYPSLAKALERHQSLEMLTLSHHLEEVIPMTEHGHIGNLRMFSKLTNLKIPLSALVNLYQSTHQDFLVNMPRSLRKLEILIACQMRRLECLSTVEHMASCFQDFMPFLEEVRIGCIDKDPTSCYPHHWETLLKPLSDQGVRVTIDEDLRAPSPRSGSEDLNSDGHNRHVSTFGVPDSEEESDEESLHSL